MRMLRQVDAHWRVFGLAVWSGPRTLDQALAPILERGGAALPRSLRACRRCQTQFGHHNIQARLLVALSHSCGFQWILSPAPGHVWEICWVDERGTSTLNDASTPRPSPLSFSPLECRRCFLVSYLFEWVVTGVENYQNLNFMCCPIIQIQALQELMRSISMAFRHASYSNF